MIGVHQLAELRNFRALSINTRTTRTIINLSYSRNEVVLVIYRTYRIYRKRFANCNRVTVFKIPSSRILVLVPSILHFSTISRCKNFTL